MVILAGAFLLGVIFGALCVDLIYKSKKVGSVFIIEDKDPSERPYIFLELDTENDLYRIQKSNNVVFTVDKSSKKSSH